MVPAAAVSRVVDTTGAGDLYAAGFLFGLTHGKPLAECARLGGIAAAEALPDTGVGITREKQLGPKFIAVDNRYGTRASTVIIVDREHNVTYAERSFGGHGKFLGEVTRRFKLAAPSTDAQRLTV